MPRRNSIGNLNHIKYAFWPHKTIQNLSQMFVQWFIVPLTCFEHCWSWITVRNLLFRFLSAKLLFYFQRLAWFSPKRTFSNLSCINFPLEKMQSENEVHKNNEETKKKKPNNLLAYEITCLRLLTKRASLCGRWLSFHITYNKI